MADTISAISTAHGVSSLSVIRVSGDKSYSIAKEISKLDNITPRYATLHSLYDSSDELIDQSIIIYFASPKSFTGEDIVEFQCHGGLIVAQMVLDRVVELGARLATAGEFSKRAFINGKIDLTKAEATAKLIEAKSVSAGKILARQMRGELKDFVDSIRDDLLKSLAYSEVMIDYAEEDIPDDILKSLRNQLDNLDIKLNNIVETSLKRRGLIDGFKVAIIGKPNVGKSSLLNSLLSYDRAIVSDIAGTTRDTIEEQIRIESHIIRLIDTAGIRKAEDEIEEIGVERAIGSIDDADIIISIFDGSREFDSEDEKILNLLKNIEDKHIIVVINKNDLDNILDNNLLKQYNPLYISTKESVNIITDKLANVLNSIGDTDDIMLISTRQIDAVVSARDAIVEAKEPLMNGELEFFSYHLNDSLVAISSISKPYNSEEILDKMFGEFCLGK
ncbi:GTPase and tRNA-U34 5-formylation enzyme TrmE [hydrothermal vent metagenome]|uniref:GTPase and tRNA-U34 5-formylation enzyme TrmE n=1 Tax=hydrothermal vent metagenome TaxID=652676 RepID=A0A1W1BLC4_9ZZZZ